MPADRNLSAPAANVLLVDDKAENLLALEATLEPLGLNLIKALSGEAALRELLHRDFAAILLDVQMPGMSGFELAAEIRKSRRLRDVPILFLTAVTKSEENVMQGYAEGAVDYLFKPLSPDVLRAKVAVFVELFLKSREVSRQKDELARLVAELNRSNEELSQFAYVASHDLQEPLRKIAVFSDLLGKHPGNSFDDTGRDYLRRIARSITGMQDLVDSLLQLARTASTTPTFVDVDLGAAAREVLSEMDCAVEASGARVVVAPLPTVRADPTHMRQLLRNLIGNALKFRNPERAPRVRVFARGLDEGRCELCVKDNGIGFEKIHAKRIFEPFHRLYSRSQYAGTGIGLAVCRKIAERHGGVIAAEGVPGRGACFKVALPLAPLAVPGRV